MTTTDAVLIEHHVYRLGRPHLIDVRNALTRELIFADTLARVAAWLDVTGYRWAGLNGIWVKS